MPTTAGAVLVLLLALLPGRVGAFFYESLSGRDWRERDWQAVLRLLGLSVVGLALYSVLAHFFAWPPPKHAIPGEIAAVEANTVVTLAIPYFGHIAGSGIAGLVMALFVRTYARVGGLTYRASAWDTFAAELIQARWVVVTFKNGDVYAGLVTVADIGVAAGERDIVLRDPTLYDEATKGYRTVGYRDLFIPASLIDSIATAVSEDEEPAMFPKKGGARTTEISNAQANSQSKAGDDT